MQDTNIHPLGRRDHYTGHKMSTLQVLFHTVLDSKMLSATAFPDGARRAERVDVDVEGPTQNHNIAVRAQAWSTRS